MVLNNTAAAALWLPLAALGPLKIESMTTRTEIGNTSVCRRAMLLLWFVLLVWYTTTKWKEFNQMLVTGVLLILIFLSLILPQRPCSNSTRYPRQRPCCLFMSKDCFPSLKSNNNLFRWLQSYHLNMLLLSWYLMYQDFMTSLTHGLVAAVSPCFSASWFSCETNENWGFNIKISVLDTAKLL